MATLTISITGSTVVSGSKSYTATDASIQRLLIWAASRYATVLSTAPTNAQIMVAWADSWVNGTRNAVSQFETPTPVVPAPPDFS